MFLLVSLGEGFGVGFRRVVGGSFLVENKGKGGRGGGGWGVVWEPAKGTGKSMRTRLSNLPFGKLPFSFSTGNHRKLVDS